MYKVRICFEIANAAEYEDGSPAPAGMQIQLGESDHPIDYNKLTQNLDVPGVLKWAMLDDVYPAEDFRVISPEEYDEKYGDESDG